MRFAVDCKHQQDTFIFLNPCSARMMGGAYGMHGGGEGGAQGSGGET